MTATDVAVPPIPPIKVELACIWWSSLARASLRRKRLYACQIAHRVLRFYESGPSGSHLARITIDASRTFTCAVGNKDRLQAKLALRSLRYQLYSELDPGRNYRMRTAAENAAWCVYWATNEYLTGNLSDVRYHALASLDDDLQQKIEDLVHEHLAVWMLANPRLKPTEQSTGLARQILDERCWTVSMAGMLCDALIDAGLKDSHWLPHVLWHPDVVNLPVLGVTFLERLANPKQP